MRGSDALQESLFTVAKLDDFVPADHPLRVIRLLVNEGESAPLCATAGPFRYRPSAPPHAASSTSPRLPRR